MENAKMELAFVMNLVDGEVLCVRCQDAQGQETIVVDMVVAIVLTKHVYVIQVSHFVAFHKSLDICSVATPSIAYDTSTRFVIH